MERKIGLFSTTRLFEGLLAPGMPIHRVVGVLQQIGTLLLCQAIGMQWKEPFDFIVPAENGKPGTTNVPRPTVR